MNNLDDYMRSIGGVLEEEGPPVEEGAPNELDQYMQSIGGKPEEEAPDDVSDYMKSIGAKKVVPSKSEEREKRQHERIYENVSAYMKSKDIGPPEEVPEELQKYGAKPVDEEGDVARYGKMAGREVFARTLGTPADVVQLADTAYNWLQGDAEDTGLVGQGLAWISEKLHPITSSGIKEGIDIATGDEYAPKNVGEKIATGALDFVTMGGMLGALKKGRYLKEIGGAIGASALPELSDDPKTKAALMLVGDITGRSLSSPTAAKQALANIISAPQKLKNLSTGAIKAAEELGILPSAGIATESKYLQKLEGAGSAEALKEVSGDMMNRLEEATASKFGDTAEAGAALGERVSEEAVKELEKGLTEREAAYGSLGEKFGDKPIETPVANKVYNSFQESSAIPPDTKKAIEEAAGKVFEAGEAVPEVAKELSERQYTQLELGKSVQTDIKTRANAAHRAASEKYKALERLTENVAVNESKMESLMEKIGEIEETNAPEYLKSKFSNIKTKANAMWNDIKDGKKIAGNKLIKFEQSISDAIKWDAQHDHSRMLIPIKTETENVIQGSLTGNSLLRYRDAKRSWRDYYKTYLDPDAVRKIRFSQKPEEIETLLKKPSYLKQLTETVGEDSANAMRRSVVEKVGESKNAAKQFEEYRGVFGNKYEDVLGAFEKASGQEAATVGNLAAAVERIDERLGKTIGGGEKAALEKMRQSIVQDMKKAHPESSGFLSDQFGKLGPEAKLQRELAQAHASGNPEKLLSSLKEKKDLDGLRKAVGNTPKGKELYDSTRRMKLMDMINKEAVKGGQLQFDKLSNVTDRLLSSEFGRELIGKENVGLLNNIKEYSDVIDRAAKTFQKEAARAGKSKFPAGFLGYAAAAGMMLKGHLLLPMTYFGGKAGKMLFAKYLTDPIVKQQVLANMQKTVPQMAGKAMTLDRAYKVTRPMLDWSLPEVAKDSKED